MSSNRAQEAKAKLAEVAQAQTVLIDELLNAEAERLDAQGNKFLAQLVRDSKHIALGGKRLRGAFVYFSYLLHGGTDLAEIQKAAVAVELIHAYLLIHDDMMDQDGVRRGAKTLHQIYADEFPNLSAGNLKQAMHEQPELKAKHYGDSVAVCMGDVYSSIANRLLLDTKFSAELKIAAMHKMHEKLIEVGYGQTLDITMEILPAATEEQILEVLLLKTGTYTYEMPLQMGAILAGADAASLAQLTKYAHPAGIAFQIQDDILGLYGDPETTGKSADSDLHQGKQSLPIMKAFQLATAAEQEFLNQVVGDLQASDADFDRARDIIATSGALKYCKDKALALVTEAKQTLDYANWQGRGEGLEFLEGIADYMINRDL